MTEYEVELTMDDRCQIRQHNRFYCALDSMCGIDTDCDGQVEADFNGTFRIYALNDEQMYQLLELLKDYDYRSDVTLTCVSADDGREWYPCFPNRSTSWVLFGTDYSLIREEDQTREKIWARFQQALIKVGK